MALKSPEALIPSTDLVYVSMFAWKEKADAQKISTLSQGGVMRLQ